MAVSNWRKSVERLLGVAPRASRKQSRLAPRIEEFEKRLTPAAPVVSSIARAAPTTQLTSVASVTYAITFDQPVTGVDATDFRVVVNGINLRVNRTIAVTGSGANYTATISGLSGEGQIQLGIIDDDSILGVSNGLPLNGVGKSGGFQNQFAFNAGVNPTAVIAADVDRDGRPDLVVADKSGNSISVLLGNGDGVFRPRAVVSAPNNLTGAKAVDLNGDGAVDLVTISSEPNISVLLGNGNGTFQAARSLPLAASLVPAGFALADFNRDGRQDLAFSDANNNALWLMPGNGDGTFQSGSVAVPSALGTFVETGDFNGDGAIDLLYRNSPSGFSVSLGNGDGTFGPAKSGGGLVTNNTAVAGDFNRDGKLDVASTDASIGSGSYVRVYLGNGDGTFRSTAAVYIGKTPNALLVSDFDDDGIPDIAVTDSDFNNVGIIASKGDGAFQVSMQSGVGTKPISVAAADFNDDGLLDLATANFGSNTVSVINSKHVFFFSPAFKIDQVAPTTTIAEFPPPISDSNSANFIYYGSDGSGVHHTEYQLDGGPFTSVTSTSVFYNVTLDNLSNGVHTFAARSIDNAGNVGAPVSYTWTVDFVKPNTTLTSAPPSPSNDPSPQFAFSSVSPLGVDHQEYSLDGGPFVTATSPLRFLNLAEGRHTFNVRGVTPNGLVGREVSYSWNVDLTPPVIAFTAMPPAVSSNATANFRYTVTDPLSGGVASTISSQEFGLDGAPLHITIGPIDLIGLLPGIHSLFLRATDDAGNTGTASYTWTVTLPVAPKVLAINRAAPTEFFAANDSATFAVTFSEPVTGVDFTDFPFVTTGATQVLGPLVVTGSGASYTVTVGGLSGNGTVGLSLVDNNSIRDADGNPLSSSGALFTAQTLVRNGLDPSSQAWADFNNDGKLDVVVGEYSGSSLSILLGNGNATFRSPATITTNYRVRALAAADFSGDGNADLIVSTGFGLYYLLGNGNGTFRIPPVEFSNLSNVMSVQPGDFDGDGRLDIITFGTVGAAVFVSDTDGRNTFKPPILFATSGISLRRGAIADLNGDGKLDAVVGAMLQKNVGVFLGTGAGELAAADTYTGPGDVVAVTIGDVNGDSKPDLVLSTEAPSTIGVLLSNGNGTFRPDSTFSSGDRASQLAIADVNRDGKPDLISLSEQVSVYLGNGDGTFQPMTAFSAGAGPSTFALVDVNADGRTDLGVVSPASANLTLLLGSTGSLTGPTYSIDSAAPTTAIITRPALISNNASPSFTFTATDPPSGGVASGVHHIEYQIDSGNFLPAVSPLVVPNLSEGLHTFRVRAVDNVGNVGAVTSYSWSIDRTAPVASFTQLPPAVTFASTTFSFTANDPVSAGVASGLNHLEYQLDGGAFITTSGNVSLSNLANGAHTISIRALDNAGNASIPVSYSWLVDVTPASVQTIVRTAPAGPSTNAPSVTFTITFNKAVSGVDSGDFAVVLNGVTTSGPLVVTPNAAGNVYTVTVNGIAGGGTLGLNLVDNGTIRDALGNPLAAANAAASFQAPQFYATGGLPNGVAFGDVNHDGKADLITANPGSTSVSVLLGNGTGSFQSQKTYDAGARPQTIAVADINGDGNPDLVLGNDSGASAVNVLLGNGDGAFQPPLAAATASAPYSVVIADLNGDGIADIAAANKQSNSISVLLGNGNGAFRPQTTFAVAGGPIATLAGDFNGDGKPDLATANSTGNSVSVLLGNGNGTFQAQQTFSAGAGPHSLALGDIDLDGKLDLAVANSASDSVSILRGLGTGSFAPQQTFASTSTPLAVVFANLNGDRKPDLAVANLNGQVSVLLGNGDGSFTPQKTFASGAAPVALAVSDVNGDGRSDLAVSNAFDGTVGVLINAVNGSTQGPVYAIDRLAPAVTLVSTPPAFTNNSLANFTFTGSDPVSGGVSSGINRFEYQLDGLGFATTASPRSLLNLSSGSHTFEVRTVDNAGNVGPSVSYTWIVQLAEPTVQSITPNGNIPALMGAQRSRVVSLVVVFDRPVQIDPAAFTLALHTKNVTLGGVLQPSGVGVLPASLNSATTDNITWIVTFNGNTDDGVDGLNSLKDGVYDFTVNAAKVHPAGAATVNMIANQTLTFDRLFADTGPPVTPVGGTAGADFQAIVNTGDNLIFRAAFNRPDNYLPYLDFNGDGVINSLDNLQFRNRFNKALAWTV